MSYVPRFFLEKWIFQILLVSFSVTFDTMRGNMVLLQGVPKDLYTYAASRVIVDVFQSHIESLQLLLQGVLKKRLHLWESNLYVCGLIPL